jgi:hypothetical protein
VVGFSNTSNYSWTIASTTTGITGFNAGAFNLMTTNFGNNNPFTGTFSIQQSGLDLVLSYTGLSLLPGDANGDRTVDFNDLILLSRSYGLSGQTWATGDFSGDGVVDFNDGSSAHLVKA